MPYKRQFYNPVVQHRPEMRDANERIEMFQDSSNRWVARRIDASGDIVEIVASDFDRNTVEQIASGVNPPLQIYMVKDENDDSLWTGPGVSPRVWRQGLPPQEPHHQRAQVDAVVALMVPETGLYIHVADVVSELTRMGNESSGDAQQALYAAARAFQDAKP